MKLSVRAKPEYKRPSNWFEFSLLFHRFLLLIVASHPDRVVVVMEYFEKLLVKINLNMCSIEALIEYDHRLRETHSGTWSWIKFDQEAFEVAKAAYPHRGENALEMMGGRVNRNSPPNGYGNGGAARQRSSWTSGSGRYQTSRINQGGQGATRYNQGNRGAAQGGDQGPPYTARERTENGFCGAWVGERPCRWESKARGCRFAHWCTREKCQANKDTNHRPGQCPV